MNAQNMQQPATNRHGSSHWLADHVAAIGNQPQSAIAPIDPATVGPLLSGIDLWDLWPLQLASGALADIGGWTLWMVLSAPRLADPEERHGIARIRLMAERGGVWRDCGNALPDTLSPGSREWAGSALYDPASQRVTLFYTVAGYRNEPALTYAQRMFQTSGTVRLDGELPRIDAWTAPVESFQSDDDQYVLANQREGKAGFIKGFRDPAYFRDPATGGEYLLFTGSLKRSVSTHNGVIGIARATAAGLESWQLLPPLIIADGLNNELERPHIVFAQGRYFLFWSTQQRVFAPGGPSGPTGLYAMVAPALMGPYAPVNGTGLVAANPQEAPYQGYSWWVTNELEVAGFVDLAGVGAQELADDPAWRRAHFGGVPAPRFRLAINGDAICICAD